MGMVSKKLRESAKGRDCTFQLIGICNHNPQTTVFCHAPDQSKGMGNKAHDFLGAFGCSACHEVIDRRLGDFDRDWLRAMKLTLTWWVENGYLKIVGDDAEAKPRQEKLSKIVPRPKEFRR